VVGNALGALLDCTPDQLFSDRRLYRFEVRSLGEARKVIYAQGLQILNLPDYPVKKLADVMFWLPSRLSFPLLSEKMSRGRGDKPPSLLLELRRGRPKTEIDFLNGKVVEFGQKLGIPTPVNAALTRAYHEAMKDPNAWWEQWRGKPQSLIAELSTERDLV
jgi:2-dehydropantoate 2-reductase